MGRYFINGREVTSGEFSNKLQADAYGKSPLSEEGKKRREENIQREQEEMNAPPHSVKVIEKPPLTDAEIIEQNKVILAKIEDELQNAESSRNTQKYNELARQYNDIARTTNKSIKAENENIRYAENVVSFANLYSPEKAKEIVKSSGYENYIQERTPLDSNPSVSKPFQESFSPPGTPAGVTTYKNRWVLDANTGVWIDTQTPKDKGLVWEWDNTSYLDKRDKSTIKAEEQWRISEKSDEIGLTAKQKLSSNNPIEFGSGLFYAGGSFVLGGGEFLYDLTNHPVRTAAGYVETAEGLITKPGETISSFIGEFQRNPFRTAGYLGTQGIIFEGLPKVVRAGSEARFEFKLDSGRVYDSAYKFNPDESLLYGQSQIYPKPRSEIIGDVRNQGTTSLRTEPLDLSLAPKPIQNALSTGQRSFPVNEYTWKRARFQYKDVSINGMELVKLESGKVELREAIPQSRILSTENVLMKQSAKASAIPEKQLKLNELGLKPANPVFLADSLGKKSFPLYTSFFGGAEAVLIEGAGKGIDFLKQKYEVGKASRLERKGLLESGEQPYKADSKTPNPLYNFKLGGETKIYSGANTGDLRGDLRNTNTGAYLEQKDVRKAIFEPKGRYKLFEGVDYKSLIDQSNTQKMGSVLMQEQALSLESTQESALDTQQTTTQDIIPDIKTQDPIMEIGSRGGIGSEEIKLPKVFNQKRSPESEQGLFKGFDVYVRRKGVFRKETSQPLRMQEALNFGAFKVGRSSAASFKLQATSSNRLGKFSGFGNLGDFYRKGGIYIEKPSRRIKSREEVEEISLKGLASLRAGKRKTKGFWRI